MTLSEGKLKRLKALSNNAGIIAAAAMDQRGSLQKSLAAARGVEKSQITHQMMSEFKTAVTKVLTPHATAHSAGPGVRPGSVACPQQQRRAAARL